MLSIGDVVPEFNLPVSNKRSVKLSEILATSSVILLTYPFDFSPGWTTELLEFGKRIEEFTALGICVCGISTDSTWAHDAWREKLGLTEDLILLSDYNRSFGHAYDLLYTTPAGLQGVLLRSVLVIDTNHTLVYRWDVPDPPRLPTVDEVLSAIQ